MSLIEQAKKDIQQISGNTDEFGVALTFKSLDSTIANVVGIHAKHHTGFDEQGFPINSLIASVAVSEQFLIDQSYPVRDDNGEVSLKNHKVTAKDSNGTDFTYVIREFFPDDTVGLIVCILGTYKST